MGLKTKNNLTLLCSRVGSQSITTACDDSTTSSEPVSSFRYLFVLPGYPLRRIISVCVISMKYRIIILVIIVISLGQIILSYIANTSRMQKHTHTPTHRHRRSGFRCSISQWCPTMTELRPFSPVPLAINGRSLLHSNKRSRGRLGICDSFGCFSCIEKCLGRTEMRTRDGMCFQSIQTV